MEVFLFLFQRCLFVALVRLTSVVFSLIPLVYHRSTLHVLQAMKTIAPALLDELKNQFRYACLLLAFGVRYVQSLPGGLYSYWVFSSSDASLWRLQCTSGDGWRLSPTYYHANYVDMKSECCLFRRISFLCYLCKLGLIIMLSSIATVSPRWIISYWVLLWWCRRFSWRWQVLSTQEGSGANRPPHQKRALHWGAGQVPGKSLKLLVGKGRGGGRKGERKGGRVIRNSV